MTNFNALLAALGSQGQNRMMIQRDPASVNPLTGYHVNTQRGNPRRGKVYRTVVHGDGTRTHFYSDGTPPVHVRAPGEHNTTDLTGGVRAPTEQPQGIPFVSEDPTAPAGQQLPPALADALRRALGR